MKLRAAAKRLLQCCSVLGGLELEKCKHAALQQDPAQQPHKCNPFIARCLLHPAPMQFEEKDVFP